MSGLEDAAGTAKPLFIDNPRWEYARLRDHDTPRRAGSDGKTPAKLCVASCYFNPQGCELIAGEAQRLPRIRCRLGADRLPPIEEPEIHLITWWGLARET